MAAQEPEEVCAGESVLLTSAYNAPVNRISSRARLELMKIWLWLKWHPQWIPEFLWFKAVSAVDAWHESKNAL